MNAAQLRRKSRKQLLALAKAAGIPRPGLATKGEIIEALMAVVLPPPDAGGSSELPSNYGRTRLVIMEVEPRLIYAYWEITPQDFRAATARLAPSDIAAPWVMRFYDVTYIEFDGTNAHGYFDVPFDVAPGNWYVKLWDGEKTYFAEMGPRASDGRLIPAVRSNFVHMSRSEPSPHCNPQWLKVEAESGRRQPVGEPVSGPASREYNSESPPWQSNRAADCPEVKPCQEHSPIPEELSPLQYAETNPVPFDRPTEGRPADPYGPGSDGALIPPERTTVVDCESMVVSAVKGND